MKDIVREIVSRHVQDFFLSRYGISADDVAVDRTTNPSFGDFTTNAAMAYSKRVGMKPRDLALEIAGVLEEKAGTDHFASIEVAGPGFVNLFLSPRFVWKLVDFLIEDRTYLCGNPKEGPSYLVEFVSANPTGPLHVGHGRGAAFGDALSRLLKFSGYPVKTEYYINDAGSQMRVLGHSLYVRYLQLWGEEVELPEDHYRGEYLIDIAREVADGRGKEFVPYDEKYLEFFTEYAGRRILEGIRKDLQDFRVHFDVWFSEKELHEKGGVDEAIETLRKAGYIYEKEGALWFKSTDFGDDKDRVLVRSNGEKTYFAADVAYHLSKFKRGFEKLVDIWGADHHGYVKRLTSAVGALGYPGDVLDVILVQFVTLIKDGKAVSMSTRAARFETLREVIDEVGTDAARFFYLMRSAQSHLDFDLDLAKKTSAENPVYYVQYAHARICSVMKEAEGRGISFSSPSVEGLDGEEEMAIMKKVLEFRDVASDAASALEPHRIPFYLMELARLFHSYYNRYRFVSDDVELSRKRLSLALSVREVIRTGLDIIGVTAPERM